jgi:hypothetical protein
MSGVVHLSTKQQRCNWKSKIKIKLEIFVKYFLLCWLMSMRMPILDM